MEADDQSPSDPSIFQASSVRWSSPAELLEHDTLARTMGTDILRIFILTRYGTLWPPPLFGLASSPYTADQLSTNRSSGPTLLAQIERVKWKLIPGSWIHFSSRSVKSQIKGWNGQGCSLNVLVPETANSWEEVFKLCDFSEIHVEKGERTAIARHYVPCHDAYVSCSFLEKSNISQKEMWQSWRENYIPCKDISVESNIWRDCQKLWLSLIRKKEYLSLRECACHFWDSYYFLVDRNYDTDLMNISIQVKDHK
jgi:hypothetical protein